MTAEARATALLDEHRRLGAKLTSFGGWEMPLSYSGVIAEHRAVRTGVGIFDVSHLGKLRVKGPVAAGSLQRALTTDVEALEPGQAGYSLVLADDGGCIDDVFAYRLASDEWLVVPNAANVAAVTAAITECGGDPIDEWERWTILAIQGPRSFELFEEVFPGSIGPELALHHWGELDVFGASGFVARTGYTGERGFELYAPVETAVKAFAALLQSGGTPVGLGARDTLRLEMGYALYDHELDRDTNPLEAGLAWTIAWETPFRGREALERVKESGPRRRLFGIRCTERGVPRAGYQVMAGDDRIGTVSSGNYSPSLDTGIALAFGPSAAVPEAGEKVAIEARGRRIAGDIVKPPFLRKK